MAFRADSPRNSRWDVRDRDRDPDRGPPRHHSRPSKSRGHSREREQEQESKRLLRVKTGNINGFLDLLGDVLRLSEVTISTTHIYINRYHRWFISATSEDSPELPPNTKLLDDYTLALACLSLATKATESPRRLRDILLPAYHILHPPPQNAPLTYPSHKYDTLRQTLVQAELILLRALGFGIYTPMAYEYLPRLVSKVMDTRVYGGDIWSNGNGQDSGMEDWEAYTPAEAEECGVVEIMETGLGKRAKAWIGKAAREYTLVNWYTMRTIAIASVWLGMKEAGWSVDNSHEHQREGLGGKEEYAIERKVVSDWVDQMTSGRVDPEEFWEVVKHLQQQQQQQEQQEGKREERQMVVQ